MTTYAEGKFVITSKTTLAEVAYALDQDDFGFLAPRAAEIKAAAVAGTLLWTRNRLTTTDASRIDARPSSGED